jgi:precorrin-6A synthase
MRTVLIIGIGAGNPDYLTVQAIEAMNRADVFFIPDKGREKAALRRLREDILARFMRRPGYRTVELPIPQRSQETTDYRASVDAWHAKLENIHRNMLESELPDGQTAAFLVWGDPTLYDSTMRIVEAIRAKGFALDYEVIPGISAVQALAARHRVPLNRIAEPVLITTGRRMGDDGFPDGLDNAVVMLDGERAFEKVDPAGVEIWWGAYLGTPDEILMSGKLADIGGEIGGVRDRARQQHGWIMDTYLLRRIGKP